MGQNSGLESNFVYTGPTSIVMFIIFREDILKQ